MNLGKVIGTIAAVLFIILYLSTIQHYITDGISQLNSFNNLSSVNFAIVYSNTSELVIKANNPLQVPIYICNVSGQYIYLPSPVKIPPLSSSNITLRITNYSNLYNNIKENKETISVTVRVENTTIVKVVNI